MKRITSLFLCIMLMFTILPTNIFAQDSLNIENESSQTQETTNQEEVEGVEPLIFLSDYKVIDNVKISVEGYFFEEGTLSVEKIVSNNTLSDKDVADSYSFDIKISNKDGVEIQPSEPIKVSFEFKQIDENLTPEVYHEEEQLEVQIEGNTVIVESPGFSIYTVEFTYENKQYVLQGDSYVKLSEILSCVELTGNIDNYEVSNSELFNIYKGDEDGIEYIENYDDNGNLVEYYPINKEDGNTLYMVSLQPFTSEEWLKVTIEGIEYTIVVTDAIRMDENGDQVGTNVRFMQESTSIGTITDSRVIQGPLEDNFTASMPLAEIYIDDTIVNQTLWGKDEYNGTRVIAELLVDNTQGKYAGFQINTNTSAVSTDKGLLQNSYGGVWYDFTKRYLNDTQTLTVSGSNTNNYELFSGDIVKYTLKGMATKFDVASNAYKNYDVVITYSDILITLCQNSGTGAVDQANISSILRLIDTNMVNFTWSGGFRAGLSYNVNVKVVDPDTGALIDGSYYYPMTDIDIGRTGVGGFANLYNAGNVNRYSEQVALISNYGRPTSSGSWEQMVWIPGGNYSAAPFTNKANVTENNYPYTCNITSKTIDGKANTLLISPGGTTTAVSGKITNASGVDKDNTFYSGFITLANNTAGGINVKGYASAPTSGGVESYVLTGSQIVNHKVDASSDVGGTVFTTTTGNSDGSLSGGTLLGYNEVNKPFEISAATGQSVTYTMTPKGGYKLKNVWVKDGDIDIMTIVNTAKATVDKTQYDLDDETEKMAYETAVQNAINTALSSDTTTQAISINNLTSLGKGIYTYTFNGIQEDKSIHIDWEKTDLTVTKQMNPSSLTTADKFKFHIQLSDTSTQETTWRVRAKKNTNKFSYSTIVENGVPYYMAYYESHSESVPYSYIAIPDTIENYVNKNPYEEGWYYYSNGAYLQSYDTSIDENTTYYELDNTQSSNMTFYAYHVLGWNETTQSWDEYVIPATNSITNGSELGLTNLDEILSDNYRFISDGTHVYNLAAYDENSSDNDYLVWENDNSYSLTLGKSDISNTDFASSNLSHFIYAWKETVNKGEVRGYEGSGDASIDGEIYTTNSITEKYKSVVDTQNLVYYNLITNPNNYTLDSGYSKVEGESGLYIVTLPAGQTPNTADLTADDWDIIVGQVGAIEDNFDLEQAMINAGAKSVPGAVNTYEFELGAGETIDFNGVIPMGYNYEITEILPTNSRWRLDSQSANATVNDFDGEEEVTFTNTEKTFNVSIEKQTVDNVTGTFNFTIEIYKENVTRGQAQTITIQAYKNSEDNDVTYKLTNSGNTINIDMNGISTTIPTGDSYLSDGGSIGTLISDLITLDNTTPNSIVMNGFAGEVKAETSMSVYDEVQEIINEGNNSFSLEPTAFELRTPDIIDRIPYNPTTVPTGFNGSNGVFTTTLSNGDVKTFTNIPFGYKYEIKETVPAGWENVSKINEIGTLTNSDIVSTWVNKQKTYILKINKETVNNDSETFNFEIKVWKSTDYFNLSSPFVPKADDNNDGKADDGIYKFTLHNGESLTISGIPHGYNYEVYEVDSNGNKILVGSNIGSTDWKLKSIDGNNTGTITDDTIVTFTNELVHDLTIKKETVDNISGIFNFKIKAWLGGDGSEDYIDLSTQLGQVDSNGYYLFTLNNGQPKTLTNLPHGVKYEVYEETQDGWKLVDINGTDPSINKGVGGTSGTLNADTEEVFNNIPLYDIEINKEVTGLKRDTNKYFDFTASVWTTSYITASIERSAETESQFIEIASVKELGKHTFEVYTNKPFSFETNINQGLISQGILSGLPSLTYEKIEDNKYRILITATFLKPVEYYEIFYINETDIVDVSDEGYYEYPQKEYYDLSNSGGVSNGDGTYKFSIKHNGGFTLNDIPYDYEYEIIENDYSSELYTTTADGNATRTITGVVTENKSHTYVNDKDYADLTITKQVTGNMGNKEKDFTFYLSYGDKQRVSFPVNMMYMEPVSILPVVYNGRLYSIRPENDTYSLFDITDRYDWDINKFPSLEEVLTDYQLGLPDNWFETHPEYQQYFIENGIVEEAVYSGDTTYMPVYTIPSPQMSINRWYAYNHGEFDNYLFCYKLNGQIVIYTADDITNVQVDNTSMEFSPEDLEGALENEYTYIPITYDVNIDTREQFILSDGETYELNNLPVGTEVIIEEVDYSSEGYKTKINGESTNKVTIIMDEDKNIIVDNINNIIIPTELRTRNMYFIYLLTAVSTLIVLTTIRKRKRKSPLLSSKRN